MQGLDREPCRNPIRRDNGAKSFDGNVVEQVDQPSKSGWVPVPPDAHWEAYLSVKAIRDIASGLLTAIMAWRNKNLLWHSRGNSWCHGNYQRHAVVGIIGRSSAPPRANCAWSWNLPVDDWR
jgi:hypothetical protein